MKTLLALVLLAASVWCQPESGWSDYRYAHRLSLEAEGYTLFGWNHTDRTLIKITGRQSGKVWLNYVVVSTDHYTLESDIYDCKHRTSVATDQYESWGGNPEKHYVMDGVFVKIPPGGPTGVIDLQTAIFNSVCK